MNICGSVNEDGFSARKTEDTQEEDEDIHQEDEVIHQEDEVIHQEDKVTKKNSSYYGRLLGNTQCLALC